MAVQVETKSPYALAAGEGEAMVWFSADITLKASAAELGVVEVVAQPGDEPPLHIHRNEDEWFYLLDGEVTFHAGDENFQAAPGGFVHFPRGIQHTFTIESPSARFLVINTPGGFEQMFRRAPRTPEEAVIALNDFGMDVVGPHPREAGSPSTASDAVRPAQQQPS